MLKMWTVIRLGFGLGSPTKLELGTENRINGVPYSLSLSLVLSLSLGFLKYFVISSPAWPDKSSFTDATYVPHNVCMFMCSAWLCACVGRVF